MLSLYLNTPAQAQLEVSLAFLVLYFGFTPRSSSSTRLIYLVSLSAHTALVNSLVVLVLAPLPPPFNLLGLSNTSV